MYDLAWCKREVDRQYKVCHIKYCGRNDNVYSNAIEKYKYFKPVAELCFEQNVEPKLYVEAQFYFLAQFYADMGVEVFPLKSINTSKESIDRYNRFLKVNKIQTGSIGVSAKDILEDDDDEIFNQALLRFGTVYFRTGLYEVAIENAQEIYERFKVVADKDIAIQVLYSISPAIVPYLQFKDGWTWHELYETLLELSVIESN